MAVGSQGVDMRGSHVDWKNAHALNRIHKEEAVVLVAKLSNRGQIDPVTAQVVHVTDGEEPRARNRRGNFVHWIVDGEPGDLNAAGGQPKPRVVVSREFLFKSD